MNRDEIIARLRENEAALRERGVAHAALFGSRARGDQRSESDTDIMIEFDPEAQWPRGIALEQGQSQRQCGSWLMVDLFGADWPDRAFIDSRLRRHEFQREVWKWSKADQRALRVELEQMPLPPRSPDPWAFPPYDTPEGMRASEMVFKSFALQRGLLTEGFFNPVTITVHPATENVVAVASPAPPAHRTVFLRRLLQTIPALGR